MGGSRVSLSRADIGIWLINLPRATGRRAAMEARLLSRMMSVTRPIDHEINRFFAHDFRLFGIEPFSSHVDDEGQSQITGTDFPAAAKIRKWQRLPKNRLKAGNYFRRAWWLLRKGFLRSRPGHMLALTTKAAVFK